MTVTALNEARNLLGGDSFSGVESVSLRLNKYVRIGNALKKEEISSVVECHRRRAGRIPQFTPAGATTFTAKLGARLIVDQAGGVLENAGLCLHRHFGDPYIPGSAVKGLARHAAWLEWHATEGAEKETLARAIARVFGYPTGDKYGLDAFISRACPDVAQTLSGCVAFLAAAPEGAVSLALEIVNCHHPKYYCADPSVDPIAYDNEAPNPQFFPAVEAGGEFRFVLVSLGRRGLDGVDMLRQAKAWLIAALTNQGAGAKTAAGYGWFAYDQTKEERLEAEAKERQEAQCKLAEREAQEQARLAALGPVERAADQLLKLAAEPFVHFARALADKTEDEQRAFVRLMRHPDKKDWWKTKKKRDEPLTNVIRAIAAQLKEDLL